MMKAREEGWEAIEPWLGWLFGPMAWALHQGIGYAMTPWLCEIGSRWPYHALTAVAVLLCTGGIFAAFTARRRSRRVYPERSSDRLHMMGLIGLMLSAAALGGITIEYAGSFFLSTCTSVHV